MTPFLPLLAQETAKLEMSSMPDLSRMLPGGLLCLMVIVILVVDLVRGKGPSALYPKLSMGAIAVAFLMVLFGTVKAGAVGYGGFPSLDPDALSRIFKLVFLATGFVTVLFVERSRQAFGREAEFHVILFGALAGMCYLASATEMIGFYLAFETVSYTGFLLAGYKADDRRGAEAGTKFVMFGAVSSAVMLFGLSLVYGFTGSMQFAVIAEKLAAAGSQPALVLAAIFVFGGFAFKAAAFPMQWWCPDVYEGSPAPVAAFLAVASKAAVFAAGLRVLTYGGVSGSAPALSHLMGHDSSIVQTILICSAVATMTWGNFAALRQSSLQRMLAYSSIAHAGYLLMTASVIGTDKLGQEAMAGIVFYFLIYLVMNLGAFYVVTLMRRDAGTADISALRGMGRRHPVLAVSFAIMLFSLTGLPPTAGFVGKLQLFWPVVAKGYYLLAAVGLVNGAVSLYFYAKPLREMFLAAEVEGEETRLAPDGVDLAIVTAFAVPLVILGLFGWGNVTQMAMDAVARVP
ncbi:MAG: NADH-quinone oxidoreductase subunit N [Planctomycetes bacterium]|nr:NADH-quinone oxidoreductase subunit N [Planctomycetota bacterium]